jgi:hypothetical protein
MLNLHHREKTAVGDRFRAEEVGGLAAPGCLTASASCQRVGGF